MRFDLGFDGNQQSDSLEQRAPIGLNLEFQLKTNLKENKKFFLFAMSFVEE